MTWTTLTLRVTTPLFNAGADQGVGPAADDEGVRVASIRGAMRFWFRAMVGALTGPDLKLLGTLERRVFGGVGPGEDGATASPLLLRIPRQPALVSPGPTHDFLPSANRPISERRRDDSKWILYLMGQGLADMGQMSISRPYVAPGQEFDLKLGFRHARDTPAGQRAAIESLAIASLWLTCTYGGIGARARRGFGGVRIIGATAPGATDTLPLPKPWSTPAAIMTPGLGFYEKINSIWPNGPVASCMPSISTLAGGGPFNPGAALPTFPVMSKAHAPAGLLGGESYDAWEKVLIDAGKQWRYFRAAQAHAPNQGGRAYQPYIESPEYIHTVNRQDKLFPVGALGLPVVYPGRRTSLVNVDGAGHGEPQRRRASPLWLRVVGGGDRLSLLSYAFQGEFLPADAQVRLWRDGQPVRQVQVTSEDVKRQTDQWIEVLRDNETFDRDEDGWPADQVHVRLTGDLGRPPQAPPAQSAPGPRPPMPGPRPGPRAPGR